jgi:nicotinamide-nucleotide amidase
MTDDAMLADVATLLDVCRARGLRIATAESCTGGLIAAALTSVAGSSDVVERGFVTYSNEAKTDLLGVPADLITAEGAVSEAVARRMAEGALARSLADLAVSTTGIAGPGGGSAAKPVGLVWLGVARRGAGVTAQRRFFPGSREDVRRASVVEALSLLHKAL